MTQFSSLVAGHCCCRDALSSNARSAAAIASFELPSFPSKTAEPATRTLAPAPTTSGAVFSWMPPSTSISQSRPRDRKRSDRDVGHDPPVIPVNLDAVHTRGLNRLDLLSEPSEVCR